MTQKASIKDEVSTLGLEDVLNRIDFNKRELFERWRKGWRFGGAHKITSIMEHEQVLLYDRLMDLILGPDWQENVGLVKHIMNTASRQKASFKELDEKINR